MRSRAMVWNAKNASDWARRPTMPRSLTKTCTAPSIAIIRDCPLAVPTQAASDGRSCCPALAAPGHMSVEMGSIVVRQMRNLPQTFTPSARLFTPDDSKRETKEGARAVPDPSRSRIAATAAGNRSSTSPTSPASHGAGRNPARRGNASMASTETGLGPLNPSAEPRRSRDQASQT